MENAESEQPRDDFDVKITNLVDLDTDATHPSVPSHPSSQLRFFPRHHRLPLAIIVALVILAVLIILTTAAPVRNLMVGVFIQPTPTPTPTLVPGVDLFYVQGDPSWGQLAIDGHVIAHLPIVGTDAPLRLSRGRHVLVWRDDPFVAQTCTVSVPPRYGADTCLLNETVPVNSDLFAWIIRFSVSLDSLSGDRRTALIQGTQAALEAQQSMDTVRPGELYVLSPQNPACTPARPQPKCYATAEQPLKAMLSFQLDTNAVLNELCASPEPLCTLSHQNCHLFCTGTTSVSPAGQEWDVFAPVRVVWEFTTLNGRVLEREVPDNSLWDYATGDVVDEALMPLHITWDGLEWHVTTHIDVHASSFLDPVCVTAQYGIQPFLEEANINNTSIPVLWQFAFGTLPAAGCVAVGTLHQSADSTPLPTHSSLMKPSCLHRFGVLLAANEVAQRYWPGLPLADAYEQRLAQQLAALVLNAPG